MTFTGPPHDVLEEYSRGIEEVEGGQEEALVGGSEGEMERRNLSMLLKYIKLNYFFFVVLILHHCVQISVHVFTYPL